VWVRTEVSLVRRISEIEREEWDALVGDADSPFLEWDWLDSLEQSECVGADVGWAPHHLTVRHGGRLVAAAPTYLKGHSQGEFVFDHGWAEAAQNAGISYYPKVLVAIPFTPATGRRVLTLAGQDRASLVRIVGEGLRQICDGNELSSVHVNFCAEDEIEPLRQAGFLHRQGVQYHWLNRDYGCFDDYLAQLRSKRRNQVRRERRNVAESGVVVEVHQGDDIPDELFDPMFEIYLSTIQKLYWGRQYLNRAFFIHLCERWKHNLCFVTARRGSELLAGAVNVQKAGVLYGRYWGCFREVRNLHFEVCYYRGIEHCIENGFSRFEPGAGGDFKYLRGFEGTATHSMHYLAHAGFAKAVDDFLAHERSHVDDAIDFMRERGPMKPPSGGF
jgi:predicted N-acyltransferase